jgi:hypothetical protein
MAIPGHSSMDAILFMMTPPGDWSNAEKCISTQHREWRGASHYGYRLEVAAESVSNLQISLYPRLGTRKARRRNAAATYVFPVARSSIGSNANGCSWPILLKSSKMHSPRILGCIALDNSLDESR